MSNIFTHENYPRAYIRLKPSQVVKSEVGAFSLREFQAGDVIVRSELFQDDNVMSVEEYELLDSSTKELVTAHSTITTDKLFVQANVNLLRPINYFNHSCDPNTGFDEADNYVAIKAISIGTEFLLDYSFLNTNPDYQMNCLCGSPRCRKLITGNEWRNKVFVEENSKYFCSTVREMLEREARSEG